MPQAIVTDIEGTTSSIAFVKDVLFPYAAAAIPEYLRRHEQQPEVAAILDEVAQAGALPRGDLPALTRQLLEWIEQDRKITPLKALQGLVWRAGYESGAYRAHIYADAAAALQRWHAQGLRLYVYSSGSVEAQKLFFRYSEAGDLSGLFSGYFDTTTGPKQSAESYRAIAAAIAVPSAHILFLSDVCVELDAARSAGFKTCWLQRPQDCPAPAARSDHPVAREFTEIVI
jgi:enolase-phosphatase E1